MNLFMEKVRINELVNVITRKFEFTKVWSMENFTEDRRKIQSSMLVGSESVPKTRLWYDIKLELGC